MIMIACIYYLHTNDLIKRVDGTPSTDDAFSPLLPFSLPCPCLDRARKGQLSSGPRDLRVLLACLGRLALEDLAPLGRQDPQGHQDLQLS